MVTVNSSAPEPLRLETIREILRSPGPCVTILLPPHRPGESAGSSAALIKAGIQSAAQQLAERGFPESAGADLLLPLERLASDPTFVSGSHWGRAIFRSPSVFHQSHLTQPAPASLSVGGAFTIRKLTAELALPQVFYILALSKERVTLLRCAGLHADVTRLPPGVPETLAEALELEPPDHDLENRSAAGSSAGTMHRVRFGTGSGRETKHAHLGDYYKMVDRGLRELFREPDIPLVLAGVEEDIAIYRAVSTYRDLIKNGILGSLDVSREQVKMLQQAYSILRNDTIGRQATAMMTAKEKTAPARFATDPDAILRAAFEGRVDQLWVDERAERIDAFTQGTHRSWGKGDLLNLAMVQTIIHHGKACELPGKKMPDGSMAVGILRF